MEAKKNVLEIFAYLDKVPSVSDSEIATRYSCPICMETFENVLQPFKWAPNRPVRLRSCSHLVCLHCLARWAFSPNFDNACPFVGALYGLFFFP